MAGSRTHDLVISDKAHLPTELWSHTCWELFNFSLSIHAAQVARADWLLPCVLYARDRRLLLKVKRTCAAHYCVRQERTRP